MLGIEGSVAGDLSFTKSFTREEKYRLAMANMPDPDPPKTISQGNFTLRSKRTMALGPSSSRSSFRSKYRQSRSMAQSPQNQTATPHKGNSSVRKISVEDNVIPVVEMKGPKGMKELELETVNLRLRESNHKIKKAIKGLASVLGSHEQMSATVTPKLLLSTKQTKFAHSQDNSFRQNDSSQLVEEVQSHIRARHELIVQKSMINNEEADTKYSNKDVTFNRTPIEIKQKILKADDYNISELDNIQQIWRKTARAIKILDNRRNESRRAFKILNSSAHVKDTTLLSDSNNINCLQAVVFGNNFEVDEEDFQMAMYDDNKALDLQVKMDHEIEKKKNELKHAQWLQEEKPRSNSVQNPRSNRTFFHITKARSPHPASLGMPQKQKEQYEKHLKVEFEQKSQQIEAQLEKKNKYHESLGIFSKEKNQVRLDAKKFTTVSKEKAKFGRKFIRDTMIMQQSPSPMLQNDTSSVQNLAESLPSVVHPEEHTEYNEYEDWFFKRDKPTDHPLLASMREILTRQVIAHVGSKPVSIKTHQKRVSDLKTYYKSTKVEPLDAQTFSRLQMI